MQDRFHPVTIKLLLQFILKEYEKNKTIFGLPEELFFNPSLHPEIKTSIFNQPLDTPLGVAAGPHTQMAQNIIGAWLMGARYIELKTIQTLDELDVSKPCIDMQDEGYNCEWSQELKIKESFNEYMNAWIIIHILNHKFGWGNDPGTIFNMSAGYDMKGILCENVQWFLDKMVSCTQELDERIQEIKVIYPLVSEINIPSKLSDNITLSTMHGCPADEIEEIAGYLISKRRLHTFVKLNPTLLGAENVRDIINKKLNFKTIIPDIAFEHDLKYNDALNIIRNLQQSAENQNLFFGLKLTNTLESVNNKNIFDRSVDMMYMSGRALHPVAVNLARKLQNDFKGKLLISYSAGADAFNFTDLLACGFRTVTVCSDLLKPGGYMRLNQYLNNLMSQNEQIKNNSSGTETNRALSYLNKYAESVTNSSAYKREYIKAPEIKTQRELSYFDCITAPCRDTCSTNQDIPDYLFHSSEGRFEKAYEVILKTNPFPASTGMICDHLCQNKCTRVHYDDPLQIRDIKRFVSEQPEVKLAPESPKNIKVAIIGSGPSGLSCAYYLALSGLSVEVFESRSAAGGMVRFAIPGFRLTDNAIENDIKRISGTGVIIHYDKKIDKTWFNILKEEFNYIFIGAGAQLSAGIDIPGIDAKNVIDPLDFLYNVKAGKEAGLGKNVVIIGGGNTAMDAARSALRLVGENGKVTIVYRRTINEMPADQGEIREVLLEGAEIIELASPERVMVENGKVEALVCSKMELKGTDKKGRALPVKKENSEFRILCDTIIPAVGQKTDLDFINNYTGVSEPGKYQTGIKNVFTGGDAMRGASTAINAIGDGRKAANEILKSAGLNHFNRELPERKEHTKRELTIKRSKRIFAYKPDELSLDERKSFRLTTATPGRKAVIDEAGRCLLCDEICNICTTVCPNFANYS